MESKHEIIPMIAFDGTTSLSQLVTELPLPASLPEYPENKSLLFTPEVAEKAQHLLTVRDDTLVLQLVELLSKTSINDIDIKNNVTTKEDLNEEALPELLKAVVNSNREVFSVDTCSSSVETSDASIKTPSPALFAANIVSGKEYPTLLSQPILKGDSKQINVISVSTSTIDFHELPDSPEKQNAQSLVIKQPIVKLKRLQVDCLQPSCSRLRHLPLSGSKTNKLKDNIPNKSKKGKKAKLEDTNYTQEKNLTISTCS